MCLTVSAYARSDLLLALPSRINLGSSFDIRDCSVSQWPPTAYRFGPMTPRISHYACIVWECTSLVCSALAGVWMSW
jgi:hypothetical protein